MFSIHDVCKKIKYLKITDGEELNKIIDQMNASDNYDLSKDNQAVEDILCNMTQLISLDNDHFLAKFSSLLNYLLHKQKVVLHDESLLCLTKLFIAALPSCGEWVRSDVLVGLSAIVENNADRLEEFLDELIGEEGVIVNLLNVDLHNKTVLYHAFQCLYSLLKSAENSIENYLLEICYQKCLNVLKNHLISKSSDAISLKILTSALKCLQYIFVSKTLFIRNFGELLGVLKIFSFYGLPGQTFVTDTILLPTLQCPDIPQHIESQSESDSPHPKVRKQKKNKRRTRKTPQKKQQSDTPLDDGIESQNTPDMNDSLVKDFLSSQKSSKESKWRSSSSDSELSDAESHMSKIKALQSSTRQNAYLTLQAVVKVSNKKIMYGYWSSFLPEHPLMPGTAYGQNVFTTILKDPVSQVRLCALTFLGEMLRGSKHFLSHADGRNTRHLSFTSLSAILATMISEIHRCLLLALLAESSYILLTQILKCYTILCENVPYVKLNKGLVFKFLKHIKNYISHKDIQVQIASLGVFAAIINSDVTPPEVECLMLSSDFENAISAQNSNIPLKQEVPWIVQICKENIFQEVPLPLKIQYLQLLNSFVGKYFNKSELFLVTASDVIKYCLNEPDTNIKLHGAKLLDVIGRCMNTVTDSKLQSLQPIISKLWECVLKGPLIECLTNESHNTLQSICCDCLSTLSSEDFESIPMKLRVSYVTVLLGLASDQNPIIRGAAIRCLGLFCLFPCLTQDPSFLDDVSVILIRSVEDPYVNVRFKASWSLGHLSDALFLNGSDLLRSGISSKFFCSVGMACVQYSSDCDRVKANGVRALGNCLNHITEEFICIPAMQEFISQACDVLVSSLSSHFMKVCWNSCYALRNALQNTLLIDHKKINLVDVFTALLRILKSPNFKVRISATQALTVLKQRSHYGDLYPTIWNELVWALSTTAQDVNFKELQHQETLGDQLCFSLCQLGVLLTEEDLSNIAHQALENREVLLTSMWKFGLRSSEEKIITVNLAVDRLNSLKNECLKSETETTILILRDTFSQAVLAFYEKENC